MEEVCQIRSVQVRGLKKFIKKMATIITIKSLPSIRYTRNLVDAGNGKFNLMILCWGQGHGSAIHDHADSHCLMKMLTGQLSEVRYAWPKDQDSSVETGEIYKEVADAEEGFNGEELTELSRYTLEQDEVAYINGG